MKRLLNAIRSGFLEIRFHILRSLLSLLGIILGVLNLTTLFSVLNGAQIANEGFINDLGEQDMIMISLDWRKLRFATDSSAYKLGWKDLELLENYGTTFKNAGMEIHLYENVIFGSENGEYSIKGINVPIFDMHSYELEEGRFFNESDHQNYSKVCVIGPTVSEELFGDQNPIGEKITVRDDIFKIVGTYQGFGQYSGESADSDDNPMSWKNNRVLIPATTALQRFIGWNNADSWISLYVQANSIDNVSATLTEVRNILMKAHNDEDVFNIESLLLEGQDWSEFTRIWAVVLGVVAGISLFVGGVGIMNVMLASFRERIREIGIRKSVGANNLDIFLLFLVESVIICVIGGIIGLAIGYGLSMQALENILSGLDVPVTFSWDIAFKALIFSVLMGILSGLYPAYKASKLTPVEALGY